MAIGFRTLSRCVFLMAAWCATSDPARAEEAPFLKLEKTIPLPKVEGRIDHLAADVPGQRLFVAALGNNTVEVIDLKAGKWIRSLSGFAEPQGIAYVPEFDRLFVANGDDGTCRIIDGHTFATLNTITLGDDADNVRYDATAKKIYVGYGSGGLAVLDANTGKKLGDIKLSGHPESFCLATNSPHIFVNVPSAGHIAAADRDRQIVTATWPLKDARSNFPMVLDEVDHRLFVGCRNPATVLVYDSTTGKVVATLPISGDTDDLFYDPENKLLYVSCGAGTIDIIRQIDADHYGKVTAMQTASGARTSLYVPELKLFCLAVPHRGSRPAQIQIYQAK